MTIAGVKFQSIHPKSTNEYTIRDASVSLAQHQKIEWAVDQLVNTGNLSMSFRDPETFSMLSLAVCVDLGKPWLDYETKKRKVLIVDEESSANSSARRLEEAIRGEIGDESIPIKFVSLTGLNLDDKNGDENSKKDTYPVLSALRRIAEETKAAIIIIHRSNKNDGYRGSSAIMGALDKMIKIESKDDSNWIGFTTEKSRDSMAVNFIAEVTWSENQFHLRRVGVNGRDKPLSQIQSYVIGYLTENGASPLPIIMGAIDKYSGYAVEQAVYALDDMGRVYRTNPEQKWFGVKPIYDLLKEDEYLISGEDGSVHTLPRDYVDLFLE